MRPLIDGSDLLREVHRDGPALSCHHWTGPAESRPSAITEELRKVMLTEPTCTAGCCGALYVTMRRKRDQVLWDAWENTSNITAVPTDFRFDAAQYEAELARAAADRSWPEAFTSPESVDVTFHRARGSNDPRKTAEILQRRGPAARRHYREWPRHRRGPLLVVAPAP
nr:hypothetical protein [Streptomyces umbrinus]